MTEGLVTYIYLFGVPFGVLVLLYSEPITPTGTVFAGLKILLFLVIWTVTALICQKAEYWVSENAA